MLLRFELGGLVFFVGEVWGESVRLVWRDRSLSPELEEAALSFLVGEEDFSGEREAVLRLALLLACVSSGDGVLSLSAFVFVFFLVVLKIFIVEQLPGC